MKTALCISMSVFLLVGCAEQSLLNKERTVLTTDQVNSRSNLKALGGHSAKLSIAYREAAREATKGQDAAAVVTFLAAASFVGGAVGSVSDTTLANRAFLGVGTSSIAERTVSQDAIQGIYIAAKRMNCVSTVARMGAYLLEGSSLATKGMARAATFGAIEEVKIITREALVRDVADFTKIRDDLIAGATLSEEQKNQLGRLSESTNAVDLIFLNQFLKLLDNCLGAKDALTAVVAIEVPDED